MLDIQSFFWININLLTVYQLKDRGITQFEFSTSISCYVNFIRDFLFVYFGLCFVLVSVNFVKFREGEHKLAFY